MNLSDTLTVLAVPNLTAKMRMWLPRRCECGTYCLDWLQDIHKVIHRMMIIGTTELGELPYFFLLLIMTVHDLRSDPRPA